jgi:penicillin amidase
MRTILLPLALLLAACPTEAVDEPDPTPNPLEAVPVSAEFDLPCLDAPVHVVLTEHGIPHIYGASDKDVACAQGFVTARDRFFQMDLISRNGLGRLGELLGDAGLESDIEIRSRGSRDIAQGMLEHAPPALAADWAAYAEGVNAYIDAVRSGRFPPPAELEAVYLLLGLDSPVDLMHEWTALNVAGVGATVNFEAGYETTDIKWQQVTDALQTWGLDKPEGALRHEGAITDLWNNIAPVYPIASAPRYNPEERSAGERPRFVKGARVEASTLQRAVEVVEGWDEGLWRTKAAGFGSNTWAIAPDLTEAGHAILAGDGHLSLTIPSFLYQLHLDSTLLGDGNRHVVGLTVAGAPMVGLGHNGSVAWSHTSQTSDINDYYADSVVLDDATGRPMGTLFQGDTHPLEEIVETYDVSDALGSEPGIRTISRWRTAEGRPIFSLEGTEVADATADAAAVNVFGRWIVAGDVDGDGVISAITGAASHFGEEYFIEGVLGWGEAGDVDEWYAAHQKIASYSQHFAVADTSGNILYSPFEAMPCRNYLPRDGDGTPLDGASPQALIDGTLYPSFRVTHDADHRISTGTDEVTCMLSAEQYPHEKNPDQGYILNSNNAPWAAAWDQNVWNDDLYIGGPWYGTWRASRITERILEDAGQHSVATMESMHADHRSRMATEFLPFLLDAIQQGETDATAGATEGTAGRRAAFWTANQARIEEARDRLSVWRNRGNIAHSGVESFYNDPSDDERDDSVATMIWNAWMGRFLGSVWNDEGLPGVWRPTGSYGSTRGLKTILDGMDSAGNPVVSVDPETGESVFFDDLGTPDWKESSQELALRELVNALDYLASPFTVDRTGGFGTEDMDEWRWGIKHYVKLENFVAREIGDDPLIDSIFGDLGVTTADIPLDDPPPGLGDFRRGMTGFPRPGDAFAIDAAGGIGTSDYSYGSGPVMRMAFSMDPDGVTGVNVIPGGQSADPASPFHHDQAEQWIANEASPVHFYVDDVIAHAIGREVLSP